VGDDTCQYEEQAGDEKPVVGGPAEEETKHQQQYSHAKKCDTNMK